MKKRMIEKIKTVLIYFLFLSLVAMAMIYLFEIRASHEDNQSVRLDTMWSIHGEQSSLPNLSSDKTVLLPEMICARRGGGRMVGAFAQSDLIRSLFRQISGNLSTYLGSGYSCSLLSDEEGKRLWNSARESENFVYLRFPSELPFPLIHLFLNEENLASPGNIASGKIVYLNELLLLIDERGVTTVLSRGEEGIARFSPKEGETELFFDFSLFDSYTNSKELLSFSFADEEAPLQDCTPIPTEIPVLPRFSISPEMYSMVFTDEDSHERLLRLFGFNPELASQYLESDGTTVYISTNGRLEITSDGSLSYVASSEEKCLSFESLFQSSIGSGVYDLYESIKLLSSFAKSLFGMDYLYWNNGELLVTGISSEDNGEVTLSFDLFCSNIPLVFENGRHAVSVTFSSGKISRVEIESISYRPALAGDTLLSPSFVLKNMEEKAPGENCSLSLFYPIVSKTSDNIVSAEWALTARGGE